MIISIYNHIPLEKDHSNWWYSGRIKILEYFISQLDTEKNLRILEVGPGLGVNLSTLHKFGKVDISEIDFYFVEQIKRDFKNVVNYPNLEKINKKYDLIVMLDVLEHIEDTELFLNKINTILADSGSLIISVPAYQKLFSKHDLEMHHFRRYSMKLLTTHLQSSFKIIKSCRYNSLLLPIRVLQVILFKNVNSDVVTSKFLNLIFKKVINFEVWLIKKNILFPFGLSIFCVAKKNKLFT